MEKILFTLKAQAEESGNMRISTIKRMIAYDARHPMWKVVAHPSHITAFDAVKSQIICKAA